MQNYFQKPDLSELDNISLTALRILVIFELLLQAPCDDKDINENLKNKINNCRDLSNDTICIYLNTLRLLGCEISRPTRNNDYKYTLVSHPFKLSLNKDEVKALVDIKKYIFTLSEWRVAIEVDSLLGNIFKQLSPESKKLFSSIKKNFLSRELASESFIEDIKQLEYYCKQNKVLNLLYNSPESGEKNINLVAEKITMENCAFYLWGYNEEMETTMYLRLDRILAINSVSFKNKIVTPKTINVRYKLSGNSCYSAFISEEDRVVEKNDGEIIIESAVTNKFKFIQKILSYGSDCTILHPEEIKQEVINKLQNLLKIYSDVGVE